MTTTSYLFLYLLPMNMASANCNVPMMGTVTLHEYNVLLECTIYHYGCTHTHTHTTVNQHVLTQEPLMQARMPCTSHAHYIHEPAHTYLHTNAPNITFYVWRSISVDDCMGGPTSTVSTDSHREVILMTCAAVVYVVCWYGDVCFAAEFGTSQNDPLVS